MTLEIISITLNIMFGGRLTRMVSAIVQNKSLCPSTVVFGVKTQKSVRNSLRNPPGLLIPYPIYTCVQYIDGKGEYPDDIYFSNGSWERIHYYKDLFDSGVEIEFDEHEDINVITGIIKLFFK